MQSKRELRDLAAYLVVGGIATLAEWAVFWLLNAPLRLHYISATVIAYLLSTFVNWLAGRLLLFKPASGGLIRELGEIYAASLIGLGMNALLMWCMVDGLRWRRMLSKIIATGVVFAWNYLIRKYVIYKAKP